MRIHVRPLDQVTSKKTAKTVGVQTAVDSSGHVRIGKQKRRGAFPQGTEEFRTALRIEGNAWATLASKYGTKTMLQGMSPSVWMDYANDLLGEKCYLLKVPLPNNKVDQASLKPPWSVMLSCEYEVLKEAIKRAHQSNKPLVKVLPECEDPQVREQFFVGPSALQGRTGHGNNDKKNDDRRLPEVNESWRWQKWQCTNGKGKGKGKEKSPGKGKDGKDRC